MLESPVVAIVGTRRSTSYGDRVTREIAGALARAGASVVSGMARGIDGAAHRAALDVGGRTVAVLGTGVDIAYPVGHRTLHQEIADRGLLLSELPLGEPSHKGSFPKRNRLIAALASAVIIVEAGHRSGALITARNADELSRHVGAVPGPIDSPQSAGSNLLIRDCKAVIVPCVEDAMSLAGLTPALRGEASLENDAERQVWKVLAHGPLNLDEICTATKLPARDCIATVGAMELRGLLECALTGEIRRR
jgi:DNA processing protein